MDLLWVTQVDLDQDTGASRHVIGLTRALAEEGATVRLVAKGRAQIPGVRRIRPPAELMPGALLEQALAVLASREVLRARPDLAYVRIAPSTSASVLALRALLVPVVLELNGAVLRQMADRGRSEGRIAVARLGLQAAARLARMTIVPSENLARAAAEELHARNIALVTNGVDLSSAQPGERRAAREKLGLPQELRVITLVSTLVPDLRLDLLTHAHRMLPGVGLVIVGGGEQAAFVEAMKMVTRPSCPVLALGAQPHAVAVSAIQAADLCVNVQERDLTLKGLEYAAIGRRQVCFSVPGLERLASLYPGLEAMWIVEERSPSALGAALQQGLEVQARRGDLPPEAVAAARARISWNATAKEVLGRLSEVLSRKTRA